MSSEADNAPRSIPAPVVAAGHTYGTVTDHISAIIFQHPASRGWWIGFGIAATLLGVLVLTLTMMVTNGIGVLGTNEPVGWAMPIVCMVWWIGIGHAGTLISAILLLLRQDWRTSINRFAEAMTLFAVACAVIFPIFHTGRPWYGYWFIPLPVNTMGVWPNFRSPLLWDMFAITTYGGVSILFWYVGLIPDLATMRDRTPNRFLQLFYGFISMGWRGSARHWQRYEIIYLLLAGLATPLVISVHTVVSLDFATGNLPGWHNTLFPPYFVAGAIYSGFAMVLTLTIPVRAVYGLQDFITQRHIDNMAKVMLATGLMVGYGYGLEVFIAWYSGSPYEGYLVLNRAVGPYAPFYWALIFCNILTPQLLWMKSVRRNMVVLFIISIIVNIGMWLERFVIVVTSLHRDFLPSSWGMYWPTKWDWGLYLGTIGLFLTMLFLFLRTLPIISIFEMRTLVDDSNPEDDAAEARQ